MEKRTIITRNEQNEVSPPHRQHIAGGVRFDGAVESSTHARETKLAKRPNADRGLNVAKQFHKAARSRKPVKLNVY